MTTFLRIHCAILVSGANALAASIDAISKYGGARAGYRTMLDALIPASNTLNEVICNLEGIYLCNFLLYVKLKYTKILHFFLHEQRLDAGDNPVTAFVTSAEAAMIGAESTKNLRAQVTNQN